jgi:UDP-N-acetylmuramyl tripeptide synthase
LCVYGNLSRDQLDRYGEVHAVGDAWRRVSEAHPDLAIIANAADPHVVWAAQPATVTWVDLGLRWRNDAATCPSCGSLLTWSADRFDCEHCGFAQPAAPHRLDGDAVVLDGRRIPLDLQLPGAWNLANAALALVAAVTHFGVDSDVAARAMASVESVAGRFMRVPVGDGRHATVILSKNPAGWSEALRLVAEREGAGVVIAVNARVADGKDPSWLWDVPYEWLAGHPVAAAGERRLDVAVRLRYADLVPVVDDDPLDAARALDADELYVIASYTQFSALYRKHGSRDRTPA